MTALEGLAHFATFMLLLLIWTEVRWPRKRK